MTDTGTPNATTTRLDLNPSEVDTVRQALEHLMTGLSGSDDADQIDEVQGLLSRLPRDGSLFDSAS